jgi:hypothetical protein
MEEGIFVVPQIKQIFENQAFSTKLNATLQPGMPLKTSAGTF